LVLALHNFLAKGEPHLENDIRGAAIVRSVAQGGTLKAAGESIGISSTRAGQLLRRYCRKAGLPEEIREIHASPDRYLEMIGKAPEVEKSQLRTETIRALVEQLKLKSADQLTPSYLSNITPGQLHSAGVSLTTTCTLQKWLHSCGYSLKRQPPNDPTHLKEVEKAINLLDAFYFDVSTARSQFAGLTAVEDE
jgi:transposase